MEIRKYKETDKEDLRFICRETAGTLFKLTKSTKIVVSIIFNDYYTEQEPDNIFVLADDNDKAVGYILCSSDYDKYVKLNKTTYRDRVKKTCPLYLIVIDTVLKELDKIKERPTHLHIDILPEYQRKGWGKKMITTLCEHLKSKGINHLSICGISTSSDGYKMYMKYGFKEYYFHAKHTVSLTLDL